MKYNRYDDIDRLMEIVCECLQREKVIHTQIEPGDCTRYEIIFIETEMGVLAVMPTHTWCGWDSKGLENPCTQHLVQELLGRIRGESPGLFDFKIGRAVFKEE